MRIEEVKAVKYPYPGLRTFEADEAEIFFGREEHVDDLLLRLQKNRFLGVVGPSGCGKSSLVRAGMIPALHAGLMARAEGKHSALTRASTGFAACGSYSRIVHSRSSLQLIAIRVPSWLRHSGPHVFPGKPGSFAAPELLSAPFAADAAVADDRPNYNPTIRAVVAAAEKTAAKLLAVPKTTFINFGTQLGQ